MVRSTRGCLKNAALGCGALTLLGAGALGVLVLVSLNPLGSAMAQRELLDASHGDQTSYTPPANGAVSPDRLGAFLEVRRQVFGLCEGLRTAENQFKGMERFDDAEDVDTFDVMSEAFKTARTALGLGPRTGELFEVRNQALLDVGMGLGEYTYIYVVAYHARLDDTSRSARALFHDPITNRRIRRAVRSTLANQLDALRAASGSPAAITSLEAEIAAMTENPDRLPWQDGLPDEVATSVATEREQLDALYCDVMSTLDLRHNVKRGLSIDTE